MNAGAFDGVNILWVALCEKLNLYHMLTASTSSEEMNEELVIWKIK